MSQIRKAHSVEVIEHRMKAYESSGRVDAMELIGLHDELARVERKWKAKAAGELPRKGSARSSRPLANAEHMDARFDRLKNLVDAALRTTLADANERAFLERIAAELHARTPLHRSAE